jgi:hypothetical protein
MMVSKLFTNQSSSGDDKNIGSGSILRTKIRGLSVDVQSD